MVEVVDRTRLLGSVHDRELLSSLLEHLDLLLHFLEGIDRPLEPLNQRLLLVSPEVFAPANDARDALKVLWADRYCHVMNQRSWI